MAKELNRNKSTISREVKEQISGRVIIDRTDKKLHLVVSIIGYIMAY
ncbi:MAG: hypothetical protein KH200_13460 [Clostridium sp.]|nr:hypothetical protein [Clostridium sp.]